MGNYTVLRDDSSTFCSLDRPSGELRWTLALEKVPLRIVFRRTTGALECSKESEIFGPTLDLKTTGTILWSRIRAYSSHLARDGLNQVS